MKRSKAFHAILFSLILVVSLVVPAFAQQGSYSITINDTNPNHTYTAYQVFQGDITSGTETPGGSGSYTGYVLSNIQWGSGVKAEKISDLLTALQSKSGFDTLPAENATAADVAALLDSAADLETFLGVLTDSVGDYLNASSLTATPGPGTTTATISLQEAGYYLVKDQLSGGTADDFVSDYIVQVLGQETMTPKGDKATIEKKVYEESLSAQTTEWGNGYNDAADYDIGDEVPFKLIASIPDMTGYTGYEFLITDTLSSGLDLNDDSFQVYVGSGKDVSYPGNASLTGNGTDYTLNTAPGDGSSFTISLTNMEQNENLTGSAQDKYLIVTYTATLNQNAVVGLDGNPNEADLTYSNNPNDNTSKGKTAKDYALVFTYELDGTKVDGKQPDTKLENAAFVLLNHDGTQVAKVADGKFGGWTSLPAGTGNSGAITYDDWTTFDASNPVIMTSAAQTGAFGISGLDEGTYLLREIQAPEGYNLLAEDLTLVITASTGNVTNYTGSNAGTILTSLTIKVGDGEPQAGSTANGTVAIQVANESGTTLPETGGIGTTLFYVLGGLLVAGAGVLLIVRLRMRISDNK